MPSTRDAVAFIRDPFAARLAGERGVAILNSMPHAHVLRIGMAIRTRFIDELLQEALASGRIQAVLSVGCGLDARPWRLDLPSDLRWIEIDFADVLDYKDRLLAEETPRCRRERLSIDLTDAAGRRSMYAAAGNAPTLMITEGLLMYLPSATVDAMARESWNNSAVAQWIVDLTTTAFSTALGGGTDTLKPIRHVQASDSLRGEQILEVIQNYGWKSEKMRSYIRDVEFVMDRVRRQTGGITPPPPPIPSDDPTGVHLFTK